MAKHYRLILNEVDDTGRLVRVVHDDIDAGYYISHVMRSLAKKIYEPAPVVKLAGQEALDL